MAKYGEKKYGESKYGRHREVGSNKVNIFSSLNAMKMFLKAVGEGLLSSAGSIKRFVNKNTGNGILNPIVLVSKLSYKGTGQGGIQIVGNAIKQFNKKVGNSLLLIAGHIEKRLKAVRDVGLGLVNLSNDVKKSISIKLVGATSLVGMLIRKGSFYRTISGAVAANGIIQKVIQKPIYGFVNITGLIKKLPVKIVGKGNIKGMGVLSKMQSYFIVTANNMLFPLDVKVLGDTREELIAGTRDNVDEVPGKHGEYDFGSELKARFIELKCVTKNGLTFVEKMKIKRKIAEYLNPMNGYRILIFEDDPEVEYKVKYSGKIDIKNYPKFFEFAIPFKMEEPFTSAREESVLVGSGEINNQGSIETGLIIEIAGAVTNPTVQIGSEVLKYTGTVAAGQKLIINTLFMTAKIGTANALSGYNGVFPLVETGKTTVTAGSNVTIRWKDRYL